MASNTEIVQMLRVLDSTCKPESIEWVAKIAADALEKLDAENAALKDDIDLAAEENTALYSAIPKWIPVSEPPKDSNTVIVKHRGGVSVGYYNGYSWFSNLGKSHYLSTVTHWLPMPEPPLVAPKKGGTR